MIQILIVENELDIVGRIQTVLTRNGYQAVLAFSVTDALEVMKWQTIDLVMLECSMPRMNGKEAARRIRESVFNIPILMFTGKQMPTQKYEVSRTDLEDYVVTLVDERELLLKIRGLLKRAGKAVSHELHIGAVTLDYDSFTVVRGSNSQSLPQKEFRLLYKLLSYPGRIFTRTELMDEIWGLDSESEASTVNVHISRLRKHFGEWPEFEIVAVRGLGYKAVVHSI